MNVVEVRVPEFGDAKGVSVVDVLVKKGSEIRIDDPLITLETEKASMDVPSPVSGVVNSVEIKKGDEVSAGALIASRDADDALPMNHLRQQFDQLWRRRRLASRWAARMLSVPTLADAAAPLVAANGGMMRTILNLTGKN